MRKSILRLHAPTGSSGVSGMLGSRVVCFAPLEPQLFQRMPAANDICVPTALHLLRVSEGLFAFRDPDRSSLLPYGPTLQDTLHVPPSENVHRSVPVHVFFGLFRVILEPLQVQDRSPDGQLSTHDVGSHNW